MNVEKEFSYKDLNEPYRTGMSELHHLAALIDHLPESEHKTTCLQKLLEAREPLMKAIRVRVNL